MNQVNADCEDLEHLLAENRTRMNAAVRLRLDARVRGRISSSDVVQEAYLEAARRYETYRNECTMSPVLWLRFLVMQQLQRAHRSHLGVAARSATMESHLDFPEASADQLLDAFACSEASPSQHAMRAEQVDRLRHALEELDPLSREILAMRHFECLSNRDTAEALGIKESTASQRYARALLRLRDLMEPNATSGEPAE